MASTTTYKALVEQIIAVETKDDFAQAYASIDREFQHSGKITFKDYEQLNRLLSKVGKDF